MMRTVPKALFGLAFLAFTVLWMARVVLGGPNNWDRGRAVGPFEPHNVGIAAIVGLWMIPPGLYVLTWPLRTWRRLKSTYYALTDRRAIISETGLLSRPRVRSYTARSLRLMRSEEHDNGTGDLIFESPSNWVGMAKTVGFLAIEDAHDVETLVRRTLFQQRRPRWESPELAARPAPAILGRKTYRLSLSIRLFQFVSFAAGLLTAFCIVGNLGLLGAVLILQPQLLSSLISQINPTDAGGAVGSIVAGVGTLLIAVLVAWNSFDFALAIPVEITIDEDGIIAFRRRLRKVTIPAGDIASITTGAWYDPNRFQAVVRHKGGKLRLINQFDDFVDFLATLGDLNPTVEIKGF